VNSRLIAGGAIVLLAGLGAWQGVERWQDGRAVAAPLTSPAADPTAADPTAPPIQAAPTKGAKPTHPSGIDTVDEAVDVDPSVGTTPMAQRVAVIGLLNKRNGASRDLTMKPGQAMRVGDVIVRLRACEQTAPWEQQRYTGAFVQLDVIQPDKKWHRMFSGWLFKERPSLNVVEHPIYDVWAKSCTMSFPAGGPASVPAPAAFEGSPAPIRSSAKKSAAPTPSAPVPGASTPSIAVDSNPL
jgi:hypothetical protein